MHVVLSIDIGTTHVKHACVDDEGALLHYRSLSLPYAKKHEESDIEQWVERLLDSLHDIPADIRRMVNAIGVCGQGPSLVAIDKNGAILRPVLFRTLMSDGNGADADSASNARQHSQYIPFATQYLRQRPELAQQVWQWIPIPEYFVYRLCGQAVSMLPSPRYRRYYWTPGALRHAHLRGAHFPRHRYVGSVIAPLSAAMAARVSLPSGIPLIAGGLDFCMAIIGADCLRRGAICDRAGSTQGLNFIAHPRRRHPLLQSYPLLRGSVTNQSLLMLDSGLLLAESTPAELDAARHFVRTQSLDIPPLLPTLRGQGVVQIGRPSAPSAPTTGTGTGTPPPSTHPIPRLLALETILFTMKYVLDIFRNHQHDRTPPTIALCGGQSHLPQWNTLKADLLQTECQQFQCAHTELVGMAAVAFRTLGLYPRLADAAARLSHVRHRFSPTDHLANLPRYHAFHTRLTKTLGSDGS